MYCADFGFAQYFFVAPVASEASVRHPYVHPTARQCGGVPDGCPLYRALIQIKPKS